MPLGLKDKRVIFSVVAAFAVGAVVFFVAGDSVFGGGKAASYSNPAFGVELEYPYDWVVDPAGGAFHGSPLRFMGYDGYFGVDAIAGDEGVSIEDAVSVLALQNSNKPYGSAPVVSEEIIGGMDARFVFPSSDQPEEAKSEALAVIRYPKPIVIGEASYPFFMLYADKYHLKEIAATVKFMGTEQVNEAQKQEELSE